MRRPRIHPRRAQYVGTSRATGDPSAIVATISFAKFPEHISAIGTKRDCLDTHSISELRADRPYHQPGDDSQDQRQPNASATAPVAGRGCCHERKKIPTMAFVRTRHLGKVTSLKVAIFARVSSGGPAQRRPIWLDPRRQPMPERDAAVFHLVLIKPTHYDDDGYPIQWVKAAIPSNTLACLNGLAKTPAGAGCSATVWQSASTLTTKPTGASGPIVSSGCCADLVVVPSWAWSACNRTNSREPSMWRDRFCAPAYRSASAAFTFPAQSRCCQRCRRRCARRRRWAFPFLPARQSIAGSTG
jgi:hypothetical protein